MPIETIQKRFLAVLRESSGGRILAADEKPFCLRTILRSSGAYVVPTIVF